MPQSALIRSTPDSPVDLDDTSSCPVASMCTTCGTSDDLAVCTVATLGGVACLTLCEPCEGKPLSLRPLDALSRCGQHAEHLGIDVDQMQALLDGAL